jgi:hypothetical protein
MSASIPTWSSDAASNHAGVFCGCHCSLEVLDGWCMRLPNVRCCGVGFGHSKTGRSNGRGSVCALSAIAWHALMRPALIQLLTLCLWHSGLVWHIDSHPYGCVPAQVDLHGGLVCYVAGSGSVVLVRWSPVTERFCRNYLRNYYTKSTHTLLAACLLLSCAYVAGLH